MNYLDTLDFHAKPMYSYFRTMFRGLLEARNINDTDALDWEIPPTI